MKKISSLLTKALAIVAAGALAFSVVGCGATPKNDTAKAGNSITIEVKDADGNVSSFAGNTEAEFLRGAIDDIDGVTIDGYDSDYGFYITTVNGITADYDADGAYWSIYVNGEYGSYGVDSQPVADGDVFQLAYEVYIAQ